MTTPVTACAPDTPVEECAAMMTGKRIRHLPVVTERGLAGVITIGDVLAFQVREQQEGEYVDRKSTRLNSSHSQISYAVFCLKKKYDQTADPHSCRSPQVPQDDIRIHSPGRLPLPHRDLQRLCATRRARRLQCILARLTLCRP